ncbi:ABC transporter permease [Helicobacter sp. T3_23-1059]
MQDTNYANTKNIPNAHLSNSSNIKSLPAFLHRKFLRFDKSQPFISITAILAFLGIGIGVMVLIVAMAIMNGMSKEFEKRLFVMSYPLTLHSLNRSGVPRELLNALESHFPNLSFSPYISAQSVAKINGAMEAGIVFGIEPQREAKINPVFAGAFLPREYQNPFENKKIDLQNISPALESFSQNRFGIIIGNELVDSHLLERDDKITLYFTRLEPTGLVLSPTMKRFSLFSGFSSGISAYDSAYMYANLQAIAAIKNRSTDIFDGIHIHSTKPMEDIVFLRKFLHSQIGLEISKIYGGKYGIEGWWQKNTNLFAAMDLEKNVLFIVLMLIILMASLNIISSLLMVVMNRRKEIALLLSLGASKQEIKKTFFYLGISIGFCGIVFGVILSGIALWVLDTFPIISLPSDVYGVSKLPLDLSVFDFIATLVGASIIVCLSSFYPAKKASQIDALTVLRNE